MTGGKRGSPAPGARPAPRPAPAAVDGSPGGGLTRRALAALDWAWLSVAAHAVLSVLTLAVLSRLLEPGDFGLMAMAAVLVMLARGGGLGGVGAALVQRPELTEREVSTGFWLAATAAVLAAAGVWALAPAAGELLANPAVAALLGPLSLVVALSGLAIVPEALLRRELRFRALAGVELLAQTLGYAAVTIGMALAGFGVWALVWGAVAREAVLVAAVTLGAGGLPLGRAPGRREARELLRAGAGFTMSSVARLAGERTVHLVLGRWLGAEALGYYTRASRLASPARMVVTVLARVMFPAMARRQGHAERLAGIYLLCVEALALFALPLSVLLAVTAPALVALVLGPGWEGAVPVLQVLALAVPFHLCDTLNRPPVHALGAVWRLTWREAAAGALLVLAVWAGSRWGLVGAAAGVLWARVAGYLLTSHLTLGLLGVRWGRLALCHLPGLWVGAGSGAAVWLAATLSREASLPVVAALALQVGAWGAAAALGVWFAPRFARPAFTPWCLEHLPLEALGWRGHWVRGGLAILARRHGR